MIFSKNLIKGKFIKRYKRFFIDIFLNNKKITAHCPNTGSMLGLLNKNADVWVSTNNNPKRKLKFTIELIKANKKLVGVNTHRANRIVEHGLNNSLIKEFQSIKKIKPEFKYSEDTRFDFLCDEKIFIEVKNVTLNRKNNIAEFPDSVTERGSKHLRKLIDSLKFGYKPFVLFLVQIENINKFKIAKDIDLDYYKNFLNAKKKGVKFIAYNCKLSSKQIVIDKKIIIKHE